MACDTIGTLIYAGKGQQMFRRLSGRTGAALALSAIMITGSGAAAFAHDCFNASRSAKGDAQAGTHSQAWVQIQVADLIADDVANGVYSAADGECILAAYTEAGGRLSASIHVKGATGQDGVIGSKNPHPEKASDGRGIDHFFESQFGVIVGAFETCGVTPPF